MLCLYILAGGAPVVQYFNKYGLVYPSPFFRMLQFATGVVLASCCKDSDKTDRMHKYSNMMFVLVACFSFTALGVGIFMLINKFPYWDYMYLTFMTIPVFLLMVWALYQVRTPGLLPKSLQRIILYFSAASLPFYVAQKFCFLAMKNIISVIVPEQFILPHLNLIKLLMSMVIGIIMGIMFDFFDKKIRKIILQILGGYEEK